jgi:hypothetical protein
MLRFHMRGLTANVGQVSNARVAGMEKDLRLNIGSRYTIALLVFFIPYFFFEVCANLQPFA